MNFYEPYDEYQIPVSVVKAHINEAPTVELEPRKQGKWIWKDRHINRVYKVTGITVTGQYDTVKVHDEHNEFRNYCSICGKLGDDMFMNYCPNCGAKMEK